MGKYIGPKCRLSRREGVDLELKSRVRPYKGKCKQTLPGGSVDRRSRQSVSGEQLRMQKMIQRYYGVRVAQLRRYYQSSLRKKGVASYNLILALECRLDNVVYRIGFASTRAEARQLVSHGAILVNGQRVNIASYQIRAQDVIEVCDRCKKQLRILAALELSKDYPCSWLSVDHQALKAVFNAYPQADELPAYFKANLVVELYSK